ncbi:MAG: hypothetical protein OEO77_03990 [Acidimicrobiia bacterium]|nr:hypothetical protein [Acidimicrobiia bacterium]
MAGIYVESWAPDYGTPLEHDPGLAPAAGVIDPTVEMTGWRPVTADPSVADDVAVVDFVDGTRRVDARLTLDEPSGPVAGLCGSVAVGATRWDRSGVLSTIEDVRLERLAIFASGREADIPVAGALRYESVSVAGDDPALLVRHLHGQMRHAEAQLAADLAARGHLVIADGPINALKPQSVIGFIKTHRVNYLGVDESAIVGRLEAGQRTPLFLMDAHLYARYSWYLRLAEVPGGHTWSGIVRCEVPASLGIASAVRFADIAAALLPGTAPPLHTDPRAPQNLVPIAALERHLRRSFGDAGLVYRAIRQAVMEGAA